MYFMLDGRYLDETDKREKKKKPRLIKMHFKDNPNMIF